LYAELGITKTPAGDDILAMVRDSTLVGLSIGFESLRDKWNARRDFVERLEVKLREISVVDWPAYEHAIVTGVRSNYDRLSSANALRRIQLLERQ
jgi:Escherichia/Staphylococcus phage prohead protease